MKKCKKCDDLVGQLFLECTQCEQVIHTRCLKAGSTPGNLSGDIFYVFTCDECNKEEHVERSKMTWIDVVGLVLYNLTQKHFEDSVGNGYFHRDRISKFLNKKYHTIFPHMRAKRKSWQMMLNETLRKNPEYFKAHEGNTKQDMYYKLASRDFLPNQPLIDRKQTKIKKTVSRMKDDDLSLESDSISDYDSSSRDGDTASTYEEHCLAEKQLMSVNSDNMYSKSYVKPSARLSEYLFAGEEETCSEPEDGEIDIEALDMACAVSFNQSTQPINILNDSTQCNGNISEDTLSVDDDRSWSDQSAMEVDQTIDESQRIIFQNGQPIKKGQRIMENVCKSESRLERNPDSNTLPWVVLGPRLKPCKPMNTSEELYELSQLSKRIKITDQISLAELRLHRKLALRKLKRERGLRVFDVDAWSRGEVSSMPAGNTAPRVLDRYQKQTVTASTAPEQQSFWMRLMGQTQEHTCFTSPMTNRTLKAFIRQDFESRPMWLRICMEIRSRGGEAEEQSPIVYSYVRPHHIPAVNSLAEHYFWPGINVSECLQYPDYSCVALYKKLVVGFAFLVPDVDIHEAYISFIFTRPEWRRAGIATFMLYHLIQTCIGKDITLHVSATNPALLLYQKFGFKVEEFVQDFYDKYLPVGSSDCRHALYLRLAR